MAAHHFFNVLFFFFGISSVIKFKCGRIDPLHCLSHSLFKPFNRTVVTFAGR